LASKEDNHVLVLLLHALYNVASLFWLRDTVCGVFICRAVAISNLGRLRPKLALGEIGKSAEGNQYQDDQICGVKHGDGDVENSAILWSDGWWNDFVSA
jgi:hypothetical protein